ncbi:hypothetical protein EUGRSUZ_C04020 [Eucalyptus grandis]|uniref:Uncharacterized protein n=2 Tax=Eucalyptus grandis TaxID=71139 RepID=A0A059CWT4_EUCGR|nr:hypothetical protein EUGRSUZ_C04020 [Eucalyptus grandis]
MPTWFLADKLIRSDGGSRLGGNLIDYLEMKRTHSHLNSSPKKIYIYISRLAIKREEKRKTKRSFKTWFFSLSSEAIRDSSLILLLGLIFCSFSSVFFIGCRVMTMNNMATNVINVNVVSLRSLVDVLILVLLRIEALAIAFTLPLGIAKRRASAAHGRGQESGLLVTGHDHHYLLLVHLHGLAVPFPVDRLCFAPVLFVSLGAARTAREPPVGAGQDQESEPYEPQHRRQTPEQVRHRGVPR